MRRERAPWKLWPPADIAVLRALYADTPTKAIAQQLGRAVSHVYAQANRLGLRKSEAYFQSTDSGRMQAGSQLGNGSRFRKGLKPWNTGLKGWQAGGRSRTTQFKKGQLSARWDADAYGLGALRVSTDGYLLIKYRPGAGRHTWMSMARYVWWTETGRKPRRGEVVRAINGDPHDTRMDNLELLTKAENALRNSPWTNYPPEVARLINLKGHITRQVNRITREARP